MRRFGKETGEGASRLGLPGVFECRGKFARENSDCFFDPAKASVESITKAIERTGFEVE